MPENQRRRQPTPLVQAPQVGPMGLLGDDQGLLGNQEVQRRMTARRQLESIQTRKTGTIEQPDNDLERLLTRGLGPNIELMHVLRASVQGTGASVKLANMKTKERSQEKMDRLQGDAKVVTDLVRGTVVADSFDDLLAAYKALGNNPHCEIVRVRNRFGNPKANNYRDLQVMVKLSQDVLGEVQFHMRAIMDIKNGPEHKWYEVKQKLMKEGLLEDVSDVVEQGDEHFSQQYQQAYEQYDK